MLYRLTVIILFTTLLSACGFHIATQRSLSEKYNTIVLDGSEHDVFFIQLEKMLTLNKVNTIISNGTDNNLYLAQNIPVLSCSPLNNKTTKVAVGSNSQDLEYTLRSEINCRLFTPNKKPYAIKSSLNRATLNTPGSNLSADSKNELLISENAQLLACDLIDRLNGSYFSIEKSTPVITEDSTNENIVVVFKATSADETTKEVRAKSEQEVEAIISQETQNNKN